MKGYLKDIVEWTAQKIVARAVARAVEIVEEACDEQRGVQKALSAPRLIEIEHH